MARSKKWMKKGRRTKYATRRIPLSVVGARKTSGKTYDFKGGSIARKEWGKLGGIGAYGMVSCPFPTNLFTVMTYTETLQHSQTAGGVPAWIQYRANGPYDPRVAVGGLQPRYFDSLIGDNGGTAPYRNYRVHASKISVMVFQTNSAVGTGFVNYAIIPSRSSITTPSTLDEMRERPYCKQISVGPTPSWKPQQVKNFCRIKTLLGHKDLTDVDASAGNYGAVPNEQVYWNLGLCAIDNVSVSSVRVQITIKYYCQVYSLADVADS